MNTFIIASAARLLSLSVQLQVLGKVHVDKQDMFCLAGRHILIGGRAEQVPSVGAALLSHIRAQHE